VHHLARPLALLASIASPEFAQADDLEQFGSNHGRIDLIHLDSDVQGRGACIQMRPSIPGKSAWACLWRNNPLYPELRDLLQGAFTTGKRCTVFWSSVDASSHKTIQIVECWRT
jgi:hypothetical protein